MSCSREDPDPAVTELPFFFVANINGQNLAFGVGEFAGQNFGNEEYHQTVTAGPDSLFVFEGTRVFNALTIPAATATVAVMGVFNHQPSATERASLIDTGYYRYAFSDSSSPAGAVIRFTDGNGVSWSTEGRAQSDTSFRIQTINPVSAGVAGSSFQAIFNCRLYNSNGDSINLENGSVRGKIINP